jgi:DNA-binding MarR family transcriptional regulator
MKPYPKRQKRASTNGHSEGELKLDEFLPYRVSVLANTISNDLARRYADRFGVSISQWRVMAVLGSEPDQSAVEIAARTRMDKVAVSRAVSGLRRSGYLKQRPDRVDGRRWVLGLTARGRRTFDQIVPLARAYQADLLARLDPSERRALGRLIDHLDAVALDLAREERDERGEREEVA